MAPSSKHDKGNVRGAARAAVQDRPAGAVLTRDNNQRDGHRSQPSGSRGLTVPSSLVRAGSTNSLASNGSRPSGYNEGFRYQNKPRKNHSRQPVTGTRSPSRGGQSLKGAPEPSRDIFVYRVQKGTTETIISDYMTINRISPRSVRRVSQDTAKFDSFKIELKVSDISGVLCPEFWPSGVRVRWYFQSKCHNNHGESETNQSW